VAVVAEVEVEVEAEVEVGVEAEVEVGVEAEVEVGVGRICPLSRSVAALSKRVYERAHRLRFCPIHR